MELAEALLTLGLDGVTERQTLSAAALKRAYLKAVRAHPPERDPEGFQRVREAYELLQGVASSGSTAAAPRTARASLQRSPPADDEPGVERTRASKQRPAADSATVSSVPDRFQEALTAQQYDTAADALLEIYADATLASSRPSPNRAVFLITKQFVLGEQDRGRRLLLAFEEHVALMNRPLDARLAASWRLLAELSALAGHVPPGVTSALARGIESGDFGDATEALRVDAAWANYLSLVRSLKEYESVTPGYEKLRVDALRSCPQLEDELPTSP